MRALGEDDEEEGTSGRVLVGIFCGSVTLGKREAPRENIASFQ